MGEEQASSQYCGKIRPRSVNKSILNHQEKRLLLPEVRDRQTVGRVQPVEESVTWVISVIKGK